MQKAVNKQNMIFMLLLATFRLGALIDAQAYLQRRSALPEGIEIEDEFQPGYGKIIGKVGMLQGQAVIIHKDMPKGYQAKTEAPLYKGDTIATLGKSMVRLRLNDDSILTLAANTNMEINESVYDESGKNRTAFLKMAAGKARFWIKKLTEYKNSDVTIKTKTAIVGVRGSDFVVETTDESTRVTTFEKTQLEVISLSAPCQKPGDFSDKSECDLKPLVINDFQRTVIELGQLPSVTEDLISDEIENLKIELPITTDGGNPNQQLKQERTTLDKRKDGLTKDKTRLNQDEIRAQMPEKVLIPNQHLVKPEHALPLDKKIFQKSLPDRDKLFKLQPPPPPELIADIQHEIFVENEIKKLPDFPGPPK